MRLKTRLSITLVAVTATALSGSFVAVGFLVLRDETTDLDNAVRAQAHATAYLVAQRNPLHPSVLDGEGEAPELYQPTQRYVAIYDEKGNLLSASRSFRHEAPGLLAIGGEGTGDSAPMNLDVNGVHLRGIVVPFGDGRSRLLYAITRRSVDDDLRFLLRVFIALFVGATGVTALIARWLGSRLAADVGAIAGVARDVARGNFGVRVGALAKGSTETEALAADLDHMIAQLDDLMTAQRIFISHAAHELRSPLATLRGELQLALRRPRDENEYKAFIEDALTEVEALVALAEDLLVLARVQRAREGTSSTFVGDAFADALRMVRGPAQEKGVRIVEPPETSLHVAVNGARADVARAIRNLLDNAIEHSPAGATVTVAITPGPAKIRISVADSGTGVSDEDAAHIFSPFYRGSKDRSGDTRGTGLGLAIVREIARAYGGDVSLDHTYRPGARFILELPIAKTPPEARESLPPSSRPAGTLTLDHGR